MGLLPEKKIWNVPELVERLFLGFTSAFHMAHLQLVNKQHLLQSLEESCEGKLMWRRATGGVEGETEKEFEGSGGNFEADADRTEDEGKDGCQGEPNIFASSV